MPGAFAGFQQFQFRHNGQMVRCLAGCGGVVDPGGQYLDVVRRNDPVQREHGPAGRETGAGPGDPEPAAEDTKTTSVRIPLVQVAHDDCWQFGFGCVYGLKNGFCLPSTIAAQKAQVGGDDAQAMAIALFQGPPSARRAAPGPVG